jgi:Na+/H+ antiporter NhaD/arsenite permease-like protein
MEEAFAHTELALLMFFISLFIIVGGVEHSQFLEFLGQFIIPFVESDLLTATVRSAATEIRAEIEFL